MKTYRQKIGSWGELVAANCIRAAGFYLIAQNVRTPYGEIDLIAQRGQTIVFFEVKTRSTDDFGNPEESVDSKKIEHLVSAAQFFIQQHPAFMGEWRIDLIAIRGRLGEKDPEIEWFENVAN
ncbi:MAG: YraN family protein [Chloroflexota bacterium]